MKPHEETWEDVPGVEVDVRDIISVGEATTIRDVPTRVAGLVAAAPEMARALLEHMKRHGPRCDCNFCFDAHAALTKAGVIP